MKTVLLIGLGRFGKHIAWELNRLGHQVMAIDKQESKINEIMPYVTDGQIGDSTNAEFLNTLGVKSYDVCIVAISNDFQSSLETTALLKELGANYIISRAERDAQEKFLRMCGADDVVYPEKQMAKWTAIRCSSDHILDFLELDKNHAIFEVDVPKVWIGKSVGEIDIRKKYNINILALRRYGKLDVSITPDTQLTREVTLLVLGEYKALQKCFRL